MTREEFHKFWTLMYPKTLPISHFFKHDYADRWFRIHSLPKSKRYADNDNEWEIILTRQNEIITDLFGSSSPVLLVTGDYNPDCNIPNEEAFNNYSFTKLDDIDVHKFDSENYDEGMIYEPVFAETIWKPNQHDKLLREIADDNVIAFFLSFEKNIIVAPYDGGVDFVLKDNSTRDFYRNKYKQWLSGTESGL